MTDSFLLGEDGLLRCQAFQRFGWQTHAFGTRRANPQADVTLHQIHSNCVWNAHGVKDRGQDGDALVANEIGLTIGVRTADCVPILFIDDKRRAVAAVHAGWRGTAAHIAVHALNRMAMEFGSEPASIWAAIGPCIRECCYEVGPEVSAQFTSLFPEWANHPPPGGGKRNLNLAEANIRRMTAAGIPRPQIFDSGICTFCQIETYHSFRRQPSDPGRMLSAVARLS